MKKIGIIAKDIPAAQAAAKKLTAWLESRGKKVFVDQETAAVIKAQGYGVANYYLVTGDRAKARQVFDKILAGTGWNAFGYIAAEADLQRLK